MNCMLVRYYVNARRKNTYDFLQESVQLRYARVDPIQGPAS